MATINGPSGRGSFPLLERLFDRGVVTGLSEEQLLARFVGERDQAAFEAIVTRHGPMVLKVCRQLLSDPNDVDDAFQATFIVLARRASSLRRRDLLGNWLYGVAYRVARRARSLEARRTARISPSIPVEALSHCDPASSGLDPDDLLQLHEAVNHLPDRYRKPVILCYFEGLTREEAAERLGWPLGSVKGRLASARDLLRKRLVRRGVGLSAGAVLATIEQNARAAVVPRLLQIKAVRSALVISGESARALAATSTISMTVATLAQGVIRTMVVTQIRAIVIPVLIGAGVVTTGASVVAFQGSGSPKTHDKSTPTAVASPPEQSPPAVAITHGEKDLKTQLILKKLDEPIAMDFQNETPIEDVLKYIQAATSDKGYSGIPIYIDPVGLQEVDKNLTSPITIKLDGVPLKTTLRLVLNQLGLAYDVNAGFLMINTPNGLRVSAHGAAMVQAQEDSESAIAQADKNPKTKEVLKKLEEPIAMDFQNETPLEDVLKYIKSATSSEGYSGIPIDIDPISLKESGHTLKSPITIKLEGVPLKMTLRLVLNPLGLAYYVHDGFVKTGSIQDQFARFVDDRADRTARADKDPRTIAILKKLEEPVPMDFGDPIRIEFVLKYIQSATADANYSGIPIFIDPLGLVEAKKTLQSPIIMKKEGVPLKTTLREILKQLGLVYCVHDGFLMINSARRMYEELEVARKELGIPPANAPDSRD